MKDTSAADKPSDESGSEAGGKDSEQKKVKVQPTDVSRDKLIKKTQEALNKGESNLRDLAYGGLPQKFVNDLDWSKVNAEDLFTFACCNLIRGRDLNLYEVVSESFMAKLVEYFLTVIENNLKYKKFKLLDQDEK